MFEVLNVPTGAADLPEQIGTKAKFWFDENRRLFKEGRPGTGENWAEVVAAQLAQRLGLPHAKYCLAVYEDRQGVVTDSFAPAGTRLVLGNELIGFSARETGGRHSKGEAHSIRREAHTIGRIAALLNRKTVGVPEGLNPPNGALNAADVMCGYLLLDALIGNQDRHEENWGFVVSQEGVRLAPTFDHASSLGRNEVDAKRVQKLAQKNDDHGVPGYVKRAMTPIYDGLNQLRPLEAFLALSRVSPDRGQYWAERLSMIDPSGFDHLLRSVPDEWISEPARQFAVAMMRVNRERILREP